MKNIQNRAGIPESWFVYVNGEGERRGRNIEDEAIVQRILAGDGEAFRHLVVRYQRLIYQAVYGILRHPKDAEDVTQEAFVQIFLSLPRYQSHGLKAWMTRIAVNKAIDHKRRTARAREQLTDSLEHVSSAVEDGDVRPESPLLDREERVEVHRRLRKLPAHYRDVVVAYYFEEKSYRQIAKEQGIAVKTVESKLYRAKQWIRQHWEEEETE